MRWSKKTKILYFWIGGGLCVGIYLWFTHAYGMELGGFDVEVETGEGDILSDWNEEVSAEEHVQVQEQSTVEELPVEEQLPVEEPFHLAEHSPVEEQLPVQDIPSAQTVPQAQKEPVGQVQQNSVAPVPTITPVPTVTSVPEPSISLSPSPVVKPVHRNFSVVFLYPDFPENPEEPQIEIKSAGQVGILSVRHNGQECLWRWKGDVITWDVDLVSKKNTIEILAVTEDCRLVQMKPWVYTTEK